ncbi:MAG TPA: acetoacetate decarboxylase family protein [Bdellovibrionales bacterium]|nr:acetoacetate decarboxylase family protein [Bdellovibrionales bacterium]
MKILLVIFTLQIFAFSRALALDTCAAFEMVPHEGVWTLTNGARVPYPTQTRNLDSYILFGSLSASRAAEYLAPHGLKPASVAGRALAALSVYDYKESDVGPFRESYLVFLTRHNGKLALFHELAWSSEETTALMSDEIWGIPSRRARISVDAGTSFAVATPQGPVFEMSWAKKPVLHNPFAHNLSVYAVGPKDKDGRLKWSPIKSCGGASSGSFDEARGDRLVVHDKALAALLTRLGFKPLFKELARGQKAIQYLPEPARR